MADKMNNLIISDELYLDPDTRVLYNSRTGKNKKLGQPMFTVVELLFRHPNMVLSPDQFDDVLGDITDDRALKQQINRFKKILVSVSDSEEVKKLISSSAGNWIYHQPKDVLELKPQLNPDYYFSTEKRYLESNLPRLIGQYQASRTELENTVINYFIRNGESILFLTGEAGVGKSELAITVGRRLAQSRKVARIIYENSLYDTIMELYPELNGSNEQTSFEKKISALIQAYDGEFLIVDNFYDTARTFTEMWKDTVFRRLLSSNINLIFVTRYQNTGMFTSVDVPPLPAEEQIHVMRGDGLRQYSDDELLHLCDLVGGNTLLCDLIGKLLRNPYNPRSYEDIEKLLSTNTLSSSSLNVFSEKDREYFENPIYQHLKNLCGEIALSYEEKCVLNAASLLPLDGMNLRAFSRFCGCDENTLNVLHSKGLIKINDSGDLVLHKLYALYYRDPSCSADICRSDIRPFIQSLCDRYNDGELSDHRLNTSVCSVLANGYSYESDSSYKAYIGIFYACYLGLFGKYREAYEIEKESIGLSEELDTRYKALLYKDVAISAGRLDRSDEAVSYLEKAVEMIEKQDDRSGLLSAMNSLAYAYGKAGDHEKQRFKALQALELCDSGEYARNRARILNNLADCEYHLALYDDAKTHIEESLGLYDSLENIQEIWIIQANRLYGNILYAMGHKEEAFETVSRDLRFAREVLDKDHLELLRLNSCLGDYSGAEEAKSYYRQVIEQAMDTRNVMALERFEMCRDGKRQFIAYTSENGTQFRYEVPADVIDLPQVKDDETFTRVIEYSMEESRAASAGE